MNLRPKARSATLQHHPQCDVPTSRQRGGQRRLCLSGFTVIEVLVSSMLLMILIVAALNSLSILDRNSRRLSEYSTAMSIAEGQVEWLRTIKYAPPVSPFTASTVMMTNTITMALNQAGTWVITGLMWTRIEPVANGHLATVVARFTNSLTGSYNVTLQTVINQFAAGQP